MRREYQLHLKINGRSLSKVIIDSHYELKHSNEINDALILELVKRLNGHFYEPESLTKSGWEIYVNDPIYFGVKPYRMIWCLHARESSVGIINTFRRSHAKIPK